MGQLPADGVAIALITENLSVVPVLPLKYSQPTILPTYDTVGYICALYIGLFEMSKFLLSYKGSFIRYITLILPIFDPSLPPCNAL